MKKNWKILLLLLSLTSCEKIVNIDLNSTYPRYVIEGNLSNSDEGAIVKITQTKNFYENNTFPGVKNAVVKITDSGGTIHTLLYADSGVYKAFRLKGVPGETYTLSVDINGEHFSSESTMPKPVPVDSIYFSWKKYTFAPDTMYSVMLEFTDPGDVENYYRFIMRINDRKRKQIYVSSDEFVNGKSVKAEFMYFSHEDGEDSPKLQNGDIMEIEMRCIDKNVYTYFLELNKTIYGNSAGLGNPTSNIKGGALGYFSAHTVWKGKAVVVTTR